MKNPHAVALGRKGGQSKTPAKMRAFKKNAKLRWKKKGEK